MAFLTAGSTYITHIYIVYMYTYINGHVLLHVDRFATKMAKTVPFIEPSLTMAGIYV